MVTVRMDHAHVESRPAAEVPAGDDEVIEVLLIEDDVDIRDMYQLRLSVDGYRVLTAADGDEGLTMAREHQPDIIFLDIRMPNKDGMEVLTEIRADPLLAHIPVVILSNYVDRELVERSLSLGATEYLVKANTTPSSVAGSIEEWIGR
jgi:CheY-like chemotaxis protein